ncbi:hypothetical protein D3C77_300790 [compost metagenome]
MERIGIHLLERSADLGARGRVIEEGLLQIRAFFIIRIKDKALLLQRGGQSPPGGKITLMNHVWIVYGMADSAHNPNIEIIMQHLGHIREQ